MERRISDRFSVQIRDRSLREIKKKKKKTRESRVQIYQSPCSTTVFRIFDLDERNGGVITVNERIKGDELEEGKSGKQREKYESRNDTRTEEERRNREGERKKKRKKAQRGKAREREREKLCFDAIIIRGLFPATVHSTFVSDVEHPYRPRTGDHTQWALSYLPLKLGARSHAN